MKLSSNKTILVLIGLVSFSINHCSGQIDFRTQVYQEVSRIIQKVKFGKFGCNYKITHKIDSNKRIEESKVKIPNTGNLKIKYRYNKHGDITAEEISFNSKKIEITNHYTYDAIKPDHNNLTFYRIIKQSTYINALNPIEIYSIHGKNSYEHLKEQLRQLKTKKDQAIFSLIEEYPKTNTYNLPACNCNSDFEIELVDQIYDYKLLNINDKDGVSLGAGRRNGVLYYVGDIKREKWRLDKVLFSYNQSTYLVENYIYKE